MTWDRQLVRGVQSVVEPVVGTFNQRPPKPGHPPWNHNIAQYPVILEAAPSPCRRALDVGCGQGHLIERLAPVADSVIGIERDHDALAAASDRTTYLRNVTLIQADVLTAELPLGGFDLVTAVASLHHLPLDHGLARLAELVAPGGTLVVVGLAREQGWKDLVRGAAAFPVANALVLKRGHTAVGAPIEDPVESLPEIQAAADRIVPGAQIRRRLLFRYTLVWTRPADGARPPG
ncbi:MAG TPA: class I SAM-dependent methyltransferase [Acidimicrobiales bacterium]|nr:class I SAM-dependent methyltransferase [Acidimicrobiales bacterium]